MHPNFEAYLEHLRLLGRSPLSVRRYRDVLREFDAFTRSTDPSAVSRRELLRFVATSRTDGRGRAPAGVNLRIAVLKAAFSYLRGEGLLPDNRAAALVGVKQPRRSPEYLSTREVSHLLAHLADRRGRQRVRDLVLVLVLWQTGLRVAETARLTWADLDLERRCLRDVLVKGGHHRDVPLNDEVIAALRAHRAANGDTPSTAPVFTARRGRPLSVRAMQSLFSTWRVELGWCR